MLKCALLGSTAFAAIALAGAAQAQVTPEEVWKNWQEMGASSGQTITADRERRDGATLTVENMRIVMEDEGVLVVGTLDEVAFTDLGNGTVSITMSDAYPLTITIDDIDGGQTDDASPPEPTEIALTISQPGLSMIAGGGPTSTSYDFAAPSLNISVDGIDGVDAEAIDLTVDVTLTGVAGRYLVEGDTVKSLTSDFAAGSMAVAVAMADSETSDDLRFTATVADLKGTSAGTFGSMIGVADLSAALKAGLTADGGFSYGKVAFDMDFAGSASNAKANGSAESGFFNVLMNEKQLGYGAGGKGVTLTVSGSDIPFPQLSMSYAETVFDLLMPVSPSDMPQDFRLVTRLVDLAISEEIWAIFDPAATLPRDPATLIVDASGKAKMLVDIFDPSAAEQMGAAPPGELHALDLNALQVKLGGADLTGSGALTFDNSDLATFGGMPVPTGTVNLQLVGGNGLLDKLIALGLVPEEQAMGLRMMVGMFARPGDGEDTLTSTLEFKDKGFFANGMRLQ